MVKQNFEPLDEWFWEEASAMKKGWELFCCILFILGFAVYHFLPASHRAGSPTTTSTIIVTNSIEKPQTQWYLKMKSVQCVPPMPPDSRGVYPFRLGVNINDKLAGTLPFELLAFGGITNIIEEQDVLSLPQSDQYAVMFSLQKIEQPGSESDLKFTNVVNNASKPQFFTASELPIMATNNIRLIFPMFGKHLLVVYELTTNK